MKPIARCIIFSCITIAFLIGFIGCKESEPDRIKKDPFPRPVPELAEGRYNVGFLIMDGVYNTELTAPMDIFQHTIFRDSIKAMNVFTIAQQMDPVKSFEGLYILPDYSFESEDLPSIDILVVPSAEHHLDTDLDNRVMIEFVREKGEKADWVMSLCDGAFVLAEAGLLNGRTSTTFPSDVELMRKKFPGLNIVEGYSFVHDGKTITSAGGAKSFDAALYLSEYLYGKDIAESLASGLVINWELGGVEHLVVGSPGD